MAKARKISPIFLLMLAVLLAGCSPEEPSVSVSLKNNVARDAKHIADRPEPGALKIAVAAMITPRETLDIYGQMLDYIGEKVNRPVELVQRKTYAEVNDLLRRGLIDAAFVCTQAFVEGQRDFGLEQLAVPVVNGEAVYYSYLIVRSDSNYRNLQDLRGKTFAFSDPMSNTGKLLPTYLLAKMGETPDSFFSKYVFSYAHSSSIRSVSQGLVDGAAVDSLIWDYLKITDPEGTSRTRIIYTSQPFGAPPVVTHPRLNSELKTKLRETLLGMHQDPIGRSIIEKARIDKFVLVPDTQYDSVRKMLATVNRSTVGRE